MEPSNANGVPVVIFTQQPATNAGVHPYSEGRKDVAKKMTILGSLQIAFGTLCFISEVASVILFAIYRLYGLAPVGYGIWIGIPFIVTGAFGCAAGKRNNRGFMITFNILSIISASFCTILLILAALSTHLLEASFYRYTHSPYYRYNNFERTRNAERASVAMESLMIIMAVAEAVVAIWSSVVCCKVGACCCDCEGDCCCPPAPPPTQVLWTQQAIGGAQQQQQPILVYATAAPQSAADVVPCNVIHQPLAYNPYMAFPTTKPDTDIEDGDRTRLV